MLSCSNKFRSSIMIVWAIAVVYNTKDRESKPHLVQRCLLATCPCIQPGTIGKQSRHAVVASVRCCKVQGELPAFRGRGWVAPAHSQEELGNRGLVCNDSMVQCIVPLLQTDKQTNRRVPCHRTRGQPGDTRHTVSTRPAHGQHTVSTRSAHGQSGATLDTCHNRHTVRNLLLRTQSCSFSLAHCSTRCRTTSTCPCPHAK